MKKGEGEKSLNPRIYKFRNKYGKLYASLYKHCGKLIMAILYHCHLFGYFGTNPHWKHFLQSAMKCLLKLIFENRIFTFRVVWEKVIRDTNLSTGTKKRSGCESWILHFLRLSWCKLLNLHSYEHNEITHVKHLKERLTWALLDIALRF